VVALGPNTVGLFAQDQPLSDDLLSSSKAAGEAFWPMPLDSTLREQLDSNVADLRNTGERAGGAITAALFLKEFAGETPWAHLDIAGAATSSSSLGPIQKGATGVGVATLVELLC